MLIDAMEQFGLTRSLRQVGYFPTDQHELLLRELNAAVHEGGLIALTGVVGSGKSLLLRRLRETLNSEGKVYPIQSLAVEKHRVTLATLKLAIYYGLATEKDPVDLSSKPEKSEFILFRVIRRVAKPVTLFIDDAHDVNSQTLLELKRFLETLGDQGLHLSMVIAGHPRLKNNLRRAVSEEIGFRSTVLELEGIQGQQQRFIQWLLNQCTKTKIKAEDILTDEALTLLAERLVTPLQIEHYLTLAIERAYRLGEKPVTPEVVEAVMAPDLNALQPTLTRHGYNVRALSELLNIRQSEVNAFLHGQVAPKRTEELKQQLLREGMPI